MYLTHSIESLSWRDIWIRSIRRFSTNRALKVAMMRTHMTTTSQLKCVQLMEASLSRFLETSLTDALSRRMVCYMLTIVCDNNGGVFSQYACFIMHILYNDITTSGIHNNTMFATNTTLVNSILYHTWYVSLTSYNTMLYVCGKHSPHKFNSPCLA